MTAGTRVRYRHCARCPEATVVRATDGQVLIRFDDGRETLTDPRLLVVV